MTTYIGVLIVNKKITLILGVIAFFSFVTGITNVPEIMQHINNCVNYEPKSNLEVSVITEPPTKMPKDSSFIFEFNICNIGTTGEKYNYSLEMNNIKIDGELEKKGGGLLNDGETCKEIEYKLFPESKYSSRKLYSDIDLSIKVYSESLNKLLFEKTYKYSSNEEGLYELQ